jgi:2-amino-4-hydroxy-6-hydroxymethyldihydropteridine diphosphokinase
VRAYLSLGANLGDRRAALAAAVAGLAAVGRITAVSSLFETVPVGPPQPLYLNAVVALDTSIGPQDLLETCRRLEAEHGRRRTVRWGPRPLDVDILWYDGLRQSCPDLTLPHPRALGRRFVLEPWLEVWPEGQVGGRPLRWWLVQLRPTGVSRCTGAGWWRGPGPATSSARPTGRGRLEGTGPW